MAGDRRPTRHLVAVAANGGGRLDRVLADALPALSRSRLKALIEAGHVALAAPGQGAPTTTAPDQGATTITEPAYRVKPGQSFAIFVPEAEPARPPGEAIALDVVYEDADLVVIDKPAGLVVHPAPGNARGTLVNALIAHCGESLSGIGGERRPGIVHRLDKDTSGLMVIAKNDRTHRDLAAQFKARSIERAYLALVWGRPAPATGDIAGNIGRSPRNRQKMAVLARGGRPALTRYRTNAALGPAASLVECRLATGRTHQIRVHMAHRGHPVIGDTRYGGGMTPARRHLVGEAAAEAVRTLGRQALHATVIGFRHPGRGETMAFSRPLPADLEAVSALLRDSCLERI